MQYTIMVENNSMLELNSAHKCLWDATYRFNMHSVNHKELGMYHSLITPFPYFDIHYMTMVVS